MAEELMHPNDDVASRVAEVLAAANARQRTRGLGGDHATFDDFLRYQLWQVISGMWLHDITDEAPRRDGSSAGVQNVRDVVALPESFLEKYGPGVDLLRGYLAELDGEHEIALAHFDTAQSGYVAEGLDDVKGFSVASKMYGQVAATLGLGKVAIIAQRTAEEYDPYK